MSKCSICSHPALNAIDQDIEDGLTHTAISKKYKVTLQNIANHKRHMRKDIPEAITTLLNSAIEKEDTASAIRILEYKERHEKPPESIKIEKNIDDALREFLNEDKEDMYTISKEDHVLFMGWLKVTYPERYKTAYKGNI